MRNLLLIGLFLFALNADNCGTAGSVQDTRHTQAKRDVDAEDAKRTPVQMQDVHEPSYPAAEYEAAQSSASKGEDE